ncbi:DUF29 domain-containing protein [Jiella sp. M17.18]|uniref:DUF29 domain-containing protein n=1 Tax=Jiella sp. M17.18 TaxID=3234247 RepID=UPI0034DE0354
MGKRHRRAHLSGYVVLMLHLVKWEFQPERRSRSWINTIKRERVRIAVREASSSDLRTMAESQMDAIFGRAVRLASQETRLPLSTFPDTCPYTIQELRDRDFLPE